MRKILNLILLPYWLVVFVLTLIQIYKLLRDANIGRSGFSQNRPINS